MESQISSKQQKLKLKQQTQSYKLRTHDLAVGEQNDKTKNYREKPMALQTRQMLLEHYVLHEMVLISIISQSPTSLFALTTINAENIWVTDTIHG